MDINDQEVTVEELLEELYKKAAAAKLWSLIRHTAGMLHKRVEDLGPVSRDHTPLPHPPLFIAPLLVLGCVGPARETEDLLCWSAFQ